MSVVQGSAPSSAVFTVEANVYGSCGGGYAYGLTWTQPLTPQAQGSFLDMLVSSDDSEQLDCSVAPPPTTGKRTAAACADEKEEPCKKQRTTSPPPPPSINMPSRYLSCRPAVPSPLSPSTHPSPYPSPPQLNRRRSRCKEIGLFKLALDPWLRLSRSLDTITPDSLRGTPPVSSPEPQKPNLFNPATFPSAGNLLELRKKAPVLHLPFTFDDDANRARASLRFGDPFGASPWGVVDA